MAPLVGARGTAMKDKLRESDETTDYYGRDKSGPYVRKPGTHVVTAESVQAEEVPTIPLGSLQTISELRPEVSIRPVAATKAVSMPVPLVVQPAEYRRSAGEWMQLWWDGMRPAYLVLPTIPVLVGSTLAWIRTISAQTPFGHFDFWHFVGMLAAVAYLQIGANLVNDYYDYLRGIDTGNTLGPGGLIQQGLIKPRRVLVFGLSCLVLGAVLGAIVAFAGGQPAWPVYVFGLVGLLCAYFYSASGRALASLAQGELVSFVIFGPLITLGAYMVQAGRFDRTVLLYSIALGLLATTVVHLNNMRDAESDAQARKRTLAAIFGLNWSRALAFILLLGAYVIIIALGLPHNAPHLILITLWTLPMLVIVVTSIFRTDTPAGLHLAMRQALKLELTFGILLALTLGLSALWNVLPHLPSFVLPG